MNSILKNKKTNNNNKLLGLTILFLFFTVLLSILSTATAAEIPITSTDNLGQTIQNAADGDIITLDEGTYTNNVTNIIIDKNLTIQGTNPDSTTIDAGNIASNRIFNVTLGNTLTLLNITFTNGQHGDGGVIYNRGSLEIDNCVFKNNRAYNRGGAIFSNNTANVNIVNSIFDNNFAPVGGGAIDINGTTNVDIINCSFTNNRAEAGGASITSDRSNNVRIIDSNFTGNFIDMPFFMLAFRGFGIIELAGTNNALIQGCNIDSNNPDEDTYSAINLRGSTAIINYNRFIDNNGYDIYVHGEESENVNIDYNWWSINDPDMTKIVNATLNNYFVMDVINITPLINSNGTVTFNYTFKLNTGENADNSLLPYFVTYIYTNLSGEAVLSFEAKYDRTFDITVDIIGEVLYTFITDYEIQTRRNSN